MSTVWRGMAWSTIVTGVLLFMLPEAELGQRRKKDPDRQPPPAKEATSEEPSLVPGVDAPDIDHAPAPMEQPGMPPRKEQNSVLEPVVRKDVLLELKGFNGRMSVESVARSGERVEAGETIATFAAEDFERAYEDAKMNVERADLLLQVQVATNKRNEHILGLKLERAELEVESAKEALAQWNDHTKAASVERLEISLTASKASIQEMKDELDQLVTLYSKSEIAKESEQVVLNRARSRLELMERRLKLEQQEYDDYLATGIQLRQRKLELDRKSAELEFDNAKLALHTFEGESRADLIKLQIAREAAQKRLDDLEHDAAQLAIKAPASGILFLGGTIGGGLSSLKPGDRVKNGALIATIVDPGTLAATLMAPLAQREQYAVGNEIEMRCEDAGLNAIGRIVEQSRWVNGGKIAIRVEIDNPDGVFLPGMRVELQNADASDERGGSEHDHAHEGQ